MNVQIVNYVIDILFKVTAFYFLVLSIQQFRVLNHYLFESELEKGYGKLLLTLETLFIMIIYFCITALITWAYFNYDIYLSINGGSLVVMV